MKEIKKHNLFFNIALLLFHVGFIGQFFFGMKQLYNMILVIVGVILVNYGNKLQKQDSTCTITNTQRIKHLKNMIVYGIFGFILSIVIVYSAINNTKVFYIWLTTCSVFFTFCVCFINKKIKKLNNI